LQNGFNKFFKKQGGYPKFKKKGKSNDSFYIASESIKVEADSLKLPLLRSKIKMSELMFNGKINSVTLSKRANRYFASFQIEIAESVKTELPKRSVGVDIVIKSLFATSDGHEVEAIKPLRKNLRRLKDIQDNFLKKLEVLKIVKKQPSFQNYPLESLTKEKMCSINSQPSCVPIIRFSMLRAYQLKTWLKIISWP
jgi:putative transposase